MKTIQKTTALLFFFFLCMLFIQQVASCQIDKSRFDSGFSKSPDVVKAPTEAVKPTKEVETHFKNMKYSYAILSEDKVNSTRLTTYSGGGTITSRKGTKLQYKWYMTTDNKGNVVHMYVGDNRMTSFGGVLGLSRGENRRRKTACREKSGEARRQCFDRLWVDTMTDCLLAFDNKSECKKECWFRGGYCIR